VSEVFNTIGGIMMAMSFIVIGIVCLSYAKFIKEPYRKKMSYLFGVFILFSGISRGIGVLTQWHDLDLLNGILKTISGLAGMITMFLIPKSIRELAKVQTIEETHREMMDTQKKVDTLTEIAEKLNVRNPR
jgi:hypothetical protein